MITRIWTAIVTLLQAQHDHALELERITQEHDARQDARNDELDALRAELHELGRRIGALNEAYIALNDRVNALERARARELGS